MILAVIVAAIVVVGLYGWSRRAANKIADA